MTRTTASLLAALFAALILPVPALSTTAGDGSALRLTMPKGAPPPAPRPLLHQGVAVAAESRGAIAAFDADTAELLWSYEDEAEVRSPGNALLAFADDLLVLATSDARLIALELRSGRPRWQVEAAEEGGGYRYGTPPLAVEGKVIAPIGGCNAASPEDCWVAAYDAESGREEWRRALPRPDSQLADTAGIEADVVWVPPIYEPETASLFVGLAPADGTDSASPLITYALDARSGAVLWFREESRAGAMALAAPAGATLR